MLFRRVRGFNAFALTGRMYPPLPTQGVALGYWLIGLSGRTKANPKLEFFIRNNTSQLITISFSRLRHGERNNKSQLLITASQ